MALLALRGAVVALVFLALEAAEVEKPAECQEDDWTKVCFGAASCQSLAESGLTCTGVSYIQGCSAACAIPCCIATTSTTTMTHTSATHTVTTTVTTATETMTHTSTTTVTHTETTVTHTETTATVTGTTATATGTSVTATTTGTTVTATSTSHTVTETVTTTQGPAAKVTVALKVATEDAAKYAADPQVQEAYVAVMMEITNLTASQVDVEMSPGFAGNLTVAYTLTIPYESQDGEMKPSISVNAISQKLMEVNAEAFNNMLNSKVDEMTGEGMYTQEVVSITESGNNSVSGGLRIHGSLILPTLLALALLLRGS
mmetsp:Transcript_35466/g.81842  ORF Transcript_35466/g.81842 Transcript_35466/m.81842 type:complete len:316 (-) Transcript_35466:20-967(-)